MTAGPELLLDRIRAATADEYIIEGELARGGMAAVFLARDIALDRRVAIKVMLPDLMGVAGSQDRFVIEARTGAQLDHPGIVTVYAVKQRAGLTYIVMKYIEGWTIEHAIARRGALDPGIVARIGSQVAEALHFAHSQGVVHRDVKPSNIIVDKHGRPFVTDFGIAKVSTAPSLTALGMTVGTPSYMSPEQCRGLSVTAGSDQYSLGVVLYEMLTGRAPFSGTLFELLTAHTGDAPPPILDVKPDVDPALAAIVTTMLAKNEQERFPSLHDVSKALAALAPRRSQAADRQAIMTAVAPEHLESPSVATPDAASATTEEIATVPSVVDLDAATTELPAPGGNPAAQPEDAAVGQTFTAGGALPRPGRGTRVVVAVVAVVLLAAVGYAIVSRTAGPTTAPKSAQPTQAARVDSVAASKGPDSISTASRETSLTARADTAPSTRPDTSTKLPLVPALKSSTEPTKTTAAKPRPKRDSLGQTRPDSIVARCAAVNLRFSLGEEMTRADSIFLRRECAKSRPRTPEL